METNTKTRIICLSDGDIWTVASDGVFAWCTISVSDNYENIGAGFSCRIENIRGELKREIVKAFDL